MKNLTITLLLALLCVLSTQPVLAQPGSGPFTLTELGDGLYQVNNGPAVSPVSVFLVTDEGILIIDPPNPATAEWIKNELEQRFPNQPVVYVVQSHYHWDHIRGAELFSETATFISHRNMPANLEASIQAAPPPGNTRDQDLDNRLSREEAQTGTLANFDALDSNADGFLSQRELAPAVRPDIVFSDQMEINLGGKQVSLLWSQNRHTNDLLDVYFPDHKVLFATDYIWINRMCCNFQFDERPMSTWINSIRRLENLDFDMLVNSHFESGSKADLIAFRRWLEDLQYAVSSRMANGMSLAEIQADIRLEAYSDWVGYENQLDGMIASAYGSLLLE